MSFFWLMGLVVTATYNANLVATLATQKPKVPYKTLDNVAACKRIGWVHKDIGYYFIKSISLFKLGTTRCHGTRIARGVPLPVYVNLDLYSGFWCTSRCVVF